MMLKVCKRISTAPRVGWPWGMAEMSTAITTSAPICRANRTGMGETAPPSMYSWLPMRTGSKMAGTALEARTAVAVSPVRNSTAWPSCKSAATMPKGRFMASIGRPLVCTRTNLARASPLSTERPGMTQSVRLDSCRSMAMLPNSVGVLPLAYRAATTLPAEVPVTKSTWMPCSCSTCSTPMWAKPLAAPPPSARPMRGSLGTCTLATLGSLAALAGGNGAAPPSPAPTADCHCAQPPTSVPATPTSSKALMRDLGNAPAAAAGLKLPQIRVVYFPRL